MKSRYVICTLLVLSVLPLHAWMYDPDNPHPTQMDVDAAKRAEQEARSAALSHDGTKQWWKDINEANQHAQNAVQMQWRLDDNIRREQWARQRAQEERRMQEDFNRQQEFWNSHEGQDQDAQLRARWRMEEERKKAEFFQRMDSAARFFPVGDTRRFDLWWNKVRIHAMSGFTTSEEGRVRALAKQYYETARAQFADAEKVKPVAIPRPEDCRSQLEFISKYADASLKSAGLTKGSASGRALHGLVRVRAQGIWDDYVADNKRMQDEAWERVRKLKSEMKKARVTNAYRPRPKSKRMPKPDPTEYGSRMDYVEAVLLYSEQDHFGVISADERRSVADAAAAEWRRAHKLPDDE